MINKILKRVILPLGVFGILLTSCKKIDKVDELGSNAQYIQFVSVGGAEANFLNSAIAFSDPTADTAYVEGIQLMLSTSSVFDRDITATIAVDTALVNTFNTNQNPTDAYYVMPDSTYTLLTTTVTIKAGQSISEPFSIQFHPSRVNGSFNYMLPVKIVSLSGAGNLAVATATSIAYFHVIGNPLAGNYTSEGFFYHPNPNIWRAISEIKFLSAVDSNTLALDVADLGPGSGYLAYLTIDANNNVSVSAGPGANLSPYFQWDDALPATQADNSPTNYTTQLPTFPAVANYYDPSTKTIYLRYGYLNPGGTSPGYRVCEEVLQFQ